MRALTGRSVSEQGQVSKQGEERERQSHPHSHDHPGGDPGAALDLGHLDARLGAGVGHHGRWDVAEREGQGGGDQDEVVELAEERDEVGDQVDRAERVGDCDQREDAGHWGRAGVARGERDRPDFAAEAAGEGSEPAGYRARTFTVRPTVSRMPRNSS